MRRLALALLAALVAALIVACSGGSSSNKTPTSAADTPPPGTSDVTAVGTSEGTMVTSGTVTALQTVAAAITVLPNGEFATSNGDVVPPAEATQAAAAAAPAAGGPAANVLTPAVPPTEVPMATEAPPCVTNPGPGCSTPPSEATAIAPTAQGIALDGDPATPEVDGGPINAASGQTFTVGVTIATVPQPYQGYEWDLVIDGPISYVTSDASKPANLSLCSTTTRIGPEGVNEYYGGCLSTDKNITFTGSVGTISLQCTAAGAGQLRLRKQSEGSSFGTDLLNMAAEPITGDVGPPITVTCT